MHVIPSLSNGKVEWHRQADRKKLRGPVLVYLSESETMVQFWMDKMHRRQVLPERLPRSGLTVRCVQLIRLVPFSEPLRAVRVRKANQCYLQLQSKLRETLLQVDYQPDNDLPLKSAETIIR